VWPNLNKRGVLKTDEVANGLKRGRHRGFFKKGKTPGKKECTGGEKRQENPDKWGSRSRGKIFETSKKTLQREGTRGETSFVEIAAMGTT